MHAFHYGMGKIKFSWQGFLFAQKAQPGSMDFEFQGDGTCDVLKNLLSVRPCTLAGDDVLQISLVAVHGGNCLKIRKDFQG